MCPVGLKNRKYLGRCGRALMFEAGPCEVKGGGCAPRSAEHAWLHGKSAESCESLVPGCRAPALRRPRPSARSGAGGLGGGGTEGLSGALGPSYV